MVGTVFGVYLAQNYSVPNVQKLFNTGLLIGKHIEENYRKPKKPDSDEWNPVSRRFPIFF